MYDPDGYYHLAGVEDFDGMNWSSTDYHKDLSPHVRIEDYPQGESFDEWEGA